MDNPQQFHPAKVSGCIHTDLFENDLIPHPFIGDNEVRIQ